MKNIVYSCLASLILLTVSSCNNDHLRKDMIQFDRAFIPVFYYTSLGDFATAQKAMFPLKHKWQHYQSAYHFEDNASEDWKESIRMIGTWLDEADCALEEKNAFRTLIQLDHARYELVDLRIRFNMDDYYLDYLWDFEASMYNVIEVAIEPIIDPMDYDEFKILGEEIDKAWLKVLHQPFDKDLFECSPDQLRYVNAQKEKLGYAVVSLLQTVESSSSDRHELKDVALAMESAYLDYLAMFGDFKATETFLLRSR